MPQVFLPTFEEGLIHTLELSYSYPLATGDVVYENLGFRDYNTRHPVEAVYMIGYRFCNWVSLSVGAGLTYDIVNLRNYGDSFYSGYRNTQKYTNWNIPVFLNLKTYLSRGKCQPMISLSGGIYAPNIEILCDFGLGCNFRLSKRCNMYLLASFGTVPYGKFNEPFIPGTSGYSYQNATAWAPRIKVGFTL